VNLLTTHTVKRQKIRVDRKKVDPPSQKNNDFLDNIFIVDQYITQKLHISRHDFYDLDTKIDQVDTKSTPLKTLENNCLWLFLLISVDFDTFSTVKNKSKIHYKRQREIGNYSTLTHIIMVLREIIC